MLPAPQQGVSLVVVLVMLAVLAWGAAASMQSATSTERLNTVASHTLKAEQQAELALRLCEAELLKDDASRLPSLQETNLPTTALDASPAWALASTWQDPLRKTVLSGLNGTGPAPECVAERQALADDRLVYVLTARGFGPANDTARSAPVVWLQSTLVLGSP